jgi:hypothetical protein
MRGAIGYARKALGLSRFIPLEAVPLPGRGSDRSFFRLKWSSAGSAILVRYDPKRQENAYYADIALFLHEIAVSVPMLISHDPKRCLMIMEDLGDRDLWSLREVPWERRKVFYRKILAIIHKLHSFPEKLFPASKVRIMEGFGPELYRWERDYFRDHFVKGLCGIELDPVSADNLEMELSALAERLHRTGRCLIHRDLQSQNVMILSGEPFLIDFQGMRFGSLFYDLGSLLCDPYVVFSLQELGELLLFYYKLTTRDLDWPAFQEHFWEASAQRLMQALGAYAFLGRRKGLKTFLDHIPAGLRNIQRAASSCGTLPRLQELARACQASL